MSRPLAEGLQSILNAAQASGSVFLALDFDGTLAPIAESPAQVRVPEGTIETLRELADAKRATICILSGRSIADLKRKIDVDCIYAGNHGLEIDGPGIHFTHKGAEALRGIVDLACWDLEAAFSGIRGVVVERKGLTATVHYRQSPKELSDWIATTVGGVTEAYGSVLERTRAHEAWEIRPRVDWNKGSAVRLVLSRIGAADPMLVCAGDDATDEDMFTLRRNAISIHVGGSNTTAANHYVSDPEQLALFLGELKTAVSDTVSFARRSSS